MSDQAVHAGSIIATAHAQDQRNSIPYRPQYTRITGKVAASILLQQIAYWSHIKEGKPFYKFRAPCAHDWYKEGDSWTEELGMTPGGFDTALKAIGAKVTKGTGKSELLKINLVIYWTDNSRVTWYQLNERLFYEMLHLAYNDPELLGKSGFRNWLDKQGNATFLYSETTPETTQRHVATATPAPAPADATDKPREIVYWTENCKSCGETAHGGSDGFVICNWCKSIYLVGSNEIDCSMCGKVRATTPDMPYIGEVCTCQSEQALVDAFGERPERPPPKPVEHWTVQAADPCAQWGIHSNEFCRQLGQYSKAGRDVQRLGYDWEQLTQLAPDWENKREVKSWASGLWACLKAAGGAASIVLDATRGAIEEGLTIANPYSVLKMTQALVGERKRGKPKAKVTPMLDQSGLDRPNPLARR